MAKTIAVTGKGGTGKTVMAALIVKWLKENASGPILALDADPDANLGTVLGICAEKTIGDLREDTLKEIKNLPAGMSKSAYIQAGLHQVVVENEKVDLITMGRPEGPGCYCYLNNLLREFADKLQASYEWVVMDNEAGLEHLSRRTASKIQSLLVVVNENPLSIDCAERIGKLVKELKNEIGRMYVVANSVNESQSRQLKGKIDRLRMKYLDFIPYDQNIEELVFKRKSLFDLVNSKAFSKIDKIMRQMVAKQ
ncbi:MAG: AAA family ATPase [Verrucomicrobiota bacterium]